MVDHIFCGTYLGIIDNINFYNIHSTIILSELTDDVFLTCRVVLFDLEAIKDFQRLFDERSESILEYLKIEDDDSIIMQKARHVIEFFSLTEIKELFHLMNIYCQYWSQIYHQTSPRI